MFFIICLTKSYGVRSGLFGGRTRPPLPKLLFGNIKLFKVFLQQWYCNVEVNPAENKRLCLLVHLS